MAPTDRAGAPNWAANTPCSVNSCGLSSLHPSICPVTWDTYSSLHIQCLVLPLYLCPVYPSAMHFPFFFFFFLPDELLIILPGPDSLL